MPARTPRLKPHSLALALTACGGGMSARDYLTENVAYWNGTTSTGPVSFWL